MAENTKIQWTHHAFNPWVGCSKVSPGCKNCYAAAMTNARPALVLGPGVSATKDGRRLPLWGDDAPRRVTSVNNWKQPLRWDRAAAKAGERRRVFCASLADVFEDRSELEKRRQGLWALIESTPNLDWLLLTKRPENVYQMVPDHWLHSEGCFIHRRGGCGGNCGAWPRNAWIGCTVENQDMAEQRLPHLLRIPAAVRFVSYEPALEAVDFGRWLGLDGCPTCDCEGTTPEHDCTHPVLDWLIVGGESGPGARPFDLAWARSVVAQCKAAGVPVFVKQMGARPGTFWERGPSGPVDLDSHIAMGGSEPDDEWEPLNLRDRKGGALEEWPEDLRVRQWPEVRG